MNRYTQPLKAHKPLKAYKQNNPITVRRVVYVGISVWLWLFIIQLIIGFMGGWFGGSASH